MTHSAVRTFLEMRDIADLQPAAVPDAARSRRAGARVSGIVLALPLHRSRPRVSLDRSSALDRRRDPRLSADPEVSLWLMTVGGAPAGYFELRRDDAGGIEIVYFGLLPEFTGRGLGGHLLTAAVERAWAIGAEARLAAHQHARPSRRAAELPEARLHGVPRRDVPAGRLPAANAYNPGEWTRHSGLRLPNASAAANLTAFMRSGRGAVERAARRLRALYEFSLRSSRAVLAIGLGVRRHARRQGRAHRRGRPDRMPGARFFPDARLNFAENLLRRNDDRPAMVFNGENRVRRTLTAAELGARSAGSPGRFARHGIVGRRSRRRRSSRTCRRRRRGARRRGDRRGLVVLLARLRRAGRARPLRPDRAAGARSRPTATSTAAGPTTASRRVAQVRRGAADRRAHGRRSLRRGAARTSDGVPSAVPLGGVLGRRRRRAARSSRCRSITRSTSSIPRARPACPSASSMAPAAR